MFAKIIAKKAKSLKIKQLKFTHFAYNFGFIAVKKTFETAYSHFHFTYTSIFKE